MEVNERFGQLPDTATVARIAEALTRNGMRGVVVANAAEAKRKVLELLPSGAEVMDMTSMTLEGMSVTQDILESGNFRALRKKLMDPTTEAREKRQLGAAPEWVVGSVNAVTEEGSVLIASNSGSQLPAYAFGAAHVIWVVGAQKIVNNTEEGLRRLYEYSLPLEDVRARKAYGVGSAVNKILIVNAEKQPDRITVILVNEKLGF